MRLACAELNLKVCYAVHCAVIVVWVCNTLRYAVSIHKQRKNGAEIQIYRIRVDLKQINSSNIFDRTQSVNL